MKSNILKLTFMALVSLLIVFISIYLSLAAPSMIAVSTPESLDESNLNGAIIHLTLSEAAFTQEIASENITLNSVPNESTVVSHVYRQSEKELDVVLSYNNAHIGSDIIDFSVTVDASGVVENVSITSNDMIIKAVYEIEGSQVFTSTGESYPTIIQIAGYNYKDKKLYINFDLTTTKNVTANQTADFNYFINVFNSSGTLIGNYGTMEMPQIISAEQGRNSVNAVNRAVQLDSMPVSYSVVITVVKVDIN